MLKNHTQVKLQRIKVKKKTTTKYRNTNERKADKNVKYTFLENCCKKNMESNKDLDNLINIIGLTLI